jgi:hypothetical protein
MYVSFSFNSISNQSCHAVDAFNRVDSADCFCSPLFARLRKVFAVSLDMFICHPIASMRHMKDRTILSTRRSNIDIFQRFRILI